MDKQRLLEMAELVIDANSAFRSVGQKHCVNMEISRTPEITIRANWNGNAYLNHFRYKAVSPLLCDKLDPHFDGAEKKIRELMKEAGYGDIV